MKFEDSSIFLDYLAKFREHFVTIGAEINENYLKIAIFSENSRNMRKRLTNISGTFHVQLVQTCVNLVDLEKNHAEK